MIECASANPGFCIQITSSIICGSLNSGRIVAAKADIHRIGDGRGSGSSGGVACEFMCEGNNFRVLTKVTAVDDGVGHSNWSYGRPSSRMTVHAGICRRSEERSCVRASRACAEPIAGTLCSSARVVMASTAVLSADRCVIHSTNHNSRFDIHMTIVTSTRSAVEGKGCNL